MCEKGYWNEQLGVWRLEAPPRQVNPSFAGYLEHARVIRVRGILHCYVSNYSKHHVTLLKDCGTFIRMVWLGQISVGSTERTDGASSVRVGVQKGFGIVWIYRFMAVSVLVR